MGNIDSINFGNNTLYTIIGNNTGVVTHDNVSAEERPANVSPAREAYREVNDTTTSAEPKNHMQFELSGGVPRSIAYNKPDNRLFAEVPDHSAGSISMRLDGLMLDGGRQSITLGGRIYT